MSQKLSKKTYRNNVKHSCRYPFGGVMLSKKITVKSVAAYVVASVLLVLLGACSKPEEPVKKPQPTKFAEIMLDVYKSESCGCCKKWINHLDENGFKSNIHNVENISIIKDKKAIAPRYRSCHTAVSQAGYIFEGHVPAKVMQQFLNETHNDSVIGLAVPAMPVGSPGMEMGDNFQPYSVLLLKADGSYEIYAELQSYQEQF